MNLLDKVNRVYGKELRDYCEEFPILGSMLLDELSSKEYTGELTISRTLDFAVAINRNIGDAIHELYNISSEY
jgi:hypothetical protein